jgi:WD40 repeat protein
LIENAISSRIVRCPRFAALFWPLTWEQECLSGASGHLTFSPDGKILVAIHQGKTLRYSVPMLWNTADWTAQSMPGYGAAAFSTDGRLLALGGRGIKLLDTASREEIRTIKAPTVIKGEIMGPGPDADRVIPCPVTALALSPDGATIAIGCPGALRVLSLKP